MAGAAIPWLRRSDVGDLSERPEPAETDPAILLREILLDAETLLGQQFELLRAELRQELRQVRGAALSMGAGSALVAAGGMLTILMAVHGLHRSTRLPLWACYGLVGGLVGGAGGGLLARGARRAAAVPLVPVQTVEALKENIAWLKNQATL